MDRSGTSAIKDQIEHPIFAAIDMRVGRIVEVLPFPRARNPAYKVRIDLGELGERWSSAQITHYEPEVLIGRHIVCVVNMPPRNIAGFISEVLVLGAANGRGEVILLAPSNEVPLGAAVY